MTHVKTSPYYPQSNGKIEWWFKTLKGGCIRVKTPLTLEDARRLVAEFVNYYNTVRLHSAIAYVTPARQAGGSCRGDLGRAEEGNWRRPLPDGCQQQPNTEPLSLSHLSHSAICESRSVAQTTQFFRRFLQNLLDDTLRDSRITLPCLSEKPVYAYPSCRPATTNEPSCRLQAEHPKSQSGSLSFVSFCHLTSIILIYVNTSSNSPAHSDRPGKASSSFTQGKLSSIVRPD